MPDRSLSGGLLVVTVAAGVEATDQAAPGRDHRHEALAVLIGHWINEGHTIGSSEIPAVPILTSRKVT